MLPGVPLKRLVKCDFGCDMTCIVGLVENGKVYIGGDSAGVSGFDLRIRQDDKVFAKNGMVFGFTSSFRMGQILRYSLSIPDHDPRTDDYAYLCTDFVDALIKCFKEKEYATIKNSEVSGGIFLVGYKGNLYRIESDFQVGKVRQKYDACGCGEYYALGALRSLEEAGKEPIEIVEHALSVAEYFSAGVRAPFTVVSI